jgi:hypothetical protein
MKLYPIVEGHGEVAAVPVLLRRLLWDHAQFYGMDVGTPIRQTCSQFRRETEVQRMVRLALLQPDCAAVLLLFDGEDDCPFELAAKVRGWAQAAAGQTPCEVVIAYREYETWFLASMESLRGRWGIADDAAAPDNPEAKRDAKGALEEFLPSRRGYSPTIDQADMSAVFDMALAHRRNRSFRKLVKTVGDLLNQVGQPVPVWPPGAWQA